MNLLRQFGIKKDKYSKELSVTSRLLDKQALKHNIAIRKPILKSGESFYTKKLDEMHIAGDREGSTKTRCGRYCLGTNYADTKSQWVPTISTELRAIRPELRDIPEEQIFYKGGSDRERCPTCFGTRIYGDTPLYPSENINLMFKKHNRTGFEREKLNQAVIDRKQAKKIFKKTNIPDPLDKGEYGNEYRGEIMSSIGLNKRIR